MTARLLLCVAAVALWQDIPVTRQVDLTITQGTSMSAAASPDRRSIAVDLLGGIWILPFGGGTARRITPELLEARQPTWSPDSESIAFQGYADGAWHIYVIPREGGDPKAITTGEFDDREPAWSHDGSRIAFSSDRYGGITTIWQVAVSTGEVRRISRRDGWMPTWSPNDREITFVSADAGGKLDAFGVGGYVPAHPECHFRKVPPPASPSTPSISPRPVQANLLLRHEPTDAAPRPAHALTTADTRFPKCPGVGGRTWSHATPQTFGSTACAAPAP